MRRWQIIALLSVIAVSLLLWSSTRSSVAANGLSITKPEKQYMIKILDKLDEVVGNQQAILQELSVIREKVEKEEKVKR